MDPKFPTVRATATVIAIILIFTGLSSLVRRHYSNGLELVAFGVVLLIPVLRTG
jgi:hypothetical protein